MDNIITPNDSFDFSQISLDNPAPLHGGCVFTKLKHGNKGLPLYVQLPQCVSKNGIVKNSSNKRSYIDLQFNYFEKDLLTWMENLEIKCRELLFQKSELWFETEMLEEDIENIFISPIKPFRSGKYLIVRTHIPTSKHIRQEGCLIYDENERILDQNSVTEKTQFIPLVHIEGIKFSSKSFQIEINVRQIMILSLEDNIKKNCLIKSQSGNLEKTTTQNDSNNLETLDKLESLENNDIDLNKNESLKKSVINSESTNRERQVDTLEKDKDSKDSKDSKSINFEIQNELKEIKEIKNSDDNLHEIDLDVDTIEESDNISLKHPNEVYYEIYKAAYDKAKQIKQAAIEAHLEAKKIKLKYNLDDLLNSDDELSNFSDFEG